MPFTKKNPVVKNTDEYVTALHKVINEVVLLRHTVLQLQQLIASQTKLLQQQQLDSLSQVTQKEYLTQDEAAEICGVSKALIGKWRKKEGLESRKVGRHFVIRHSDLVEFIQLRSQASRPHWSHTTSGRRAFEKLKANAGQINLDETDD